MNERLVYSDNSIYLLQVHGTRAGQRKWLHNHGADDFAKLPVYNDGHGGYNDWLPECEKFYTEFACWELDPKSDKSIDKCASKWGFSEKEKIQLKKTREYFEPKGDKK